MSAVSPKVVNWLLLYLDYKNIQNKYSREYVSLTFLIHQRLSCPCCVQSINCLSKLFLDFYKPPLVSCDDIGLKKHRSSISLENSAFTAYKAFWHLQAILLGDLVGCGGRLACFLYFEARQTANIVCSRLLYPSGWAAKPSEDKAQRFI